MLSSNHRISPSVLSNSTEYGGSTTYLCETTFTCVGDHRERRHGLLLNVPLHSGLISAGVEELEESLDDWVEVWEERLPLNAFAEVDQCRCGVGVNSKAVVNFRKM